MHLFLEAFVKFFISVIDCWILNRSLNERRRFNVPSCLNVTESPSEVWSLMMDHQWIEWISEAELESAGLTEPRCIVGDVLFLNNSDWFFRLRNEEYGYFMYEDHSFSLLKSKRTTDDNLCLCLYVKTYLLSLKMYIMFTFEGKCFLDEILSGTKWNTSHVWPAG